MSSRRGSIGSRNSARRCKRRARLISLTRRRSFPGGAFFFERRKCADATGGTGSRDQVGNPDSPGATNPNYDSNPARLCSHHRCRRPGFSRLAVWRRFRPRFGRVRRFENDGEIAVGRRCVFRAEPQGTAASSRAQGSDDAVWKAGEITDRCASKKNAALSRESAAENFWCAVFRRAPRASRRGRLWSGC